MNFRNFPTQKHLIRFKEMKHLALLLTIGFMPFARSQSYSPTTQEVCYATISYLNELVTANYSNFIVNDVETLLRHADTKTFVSNTPYPGAKSSTIDDTSSTSNYRSARILFMEKKLPTEEVTEEMLTLYGNMISIIHECLRGNGFESTNNHNDPIKRIKYETIFKSPMKSDYNTFLTTNTLTVAMRLNSFKGINDKLFTHQIVLYFVRN